MYSSILRRSLQSQAHYYHQPSKALPLIFRSTSSSTSNSNSTSTSNSQHPKISVIGSGSFGSAIARILGQVQHTSNHSLSHDGKNTQNNLCIYARRESIVQEINQSRTNSQYLPILNNEPTFPPSIYATSDVTEAVADKQVIVMAVPSAFLPGILKNMKDCDGVRDDAIFVSLVKSLHYDAESGLIRTTVDDIAHYFPNHIAMALSGPNLYSEMATSESAFTEATLGYQPSSNVTATKLSTPPDLSNDPHYQAARLVQSCIETPHFQTSLCHDRLGVELCGGLKNIIALAVGFANGICENNHNTRAAIVRAGMHEMTRFMSTIAKCDYDTSRQTVFESAAGMGDLMLTCSAGRGRLLAYEFVQDLKRTSPYVTKKENVERWTRLEDEILHGMKLPDWHNAQEIHRALVDHDCAHDFPLLEAVYRIGFEGYDPEYIIEALSKSIRRSDQ